MTKIKYQTSNKNSHCVIVLLKVTMIILLLDSIANSLSSSYSLALPREYLQETGSFYFLRFLQNLGFGILIYINKVILVYIIFILLFVIIIKFIKINLFYCTILGIILSFTFYFFYAYNGSVNHFQDHFSYNIFWYSFLGGACGWIYYKKCFANFHQ